MKSMTGFGSASRSRGGVFVTVEARSVNNRYLKVSVRAPAHLSAREHEIEGMVREAVGRGTVFVNVRLTLSERDVRVRMNDSAVEEYQRLFRRLKQRTGLAGGPSVELIAGLPGVFEAEEADPTLPDEAWETVKETIGTALDRLVRMRSREGKNLKRDFGKRKTSVSRIVGKIGKRAPAVAKEAAARLEARVGRLLEGRDAPLEPPDLIRELAVLAEKSDVTEEVTRLSSHLDQYGRALEGEGAVGRRLEFLIQEMAREANTIASKSSEVETSRLCVDLKVELDRLKEQVQNVE